MTAARASHGRTTGGIHRLLDHCDTLGRVTAERRASALDRLEGELGSELARRLVGAHARSGRPFPFAFF